jgi:hypothetical protein
MRKTGSFSTISWALSSMQGRVARPLVGRDKRAEQPARRFLERGVELGARTLALVVKELEIDFVRRPSGQELHGFDEPR